MKFYCQYFQSVFSYSRPWFSMTVLKTPLLFSLGVYLKCSLYHHHCGVSWKKVPNEGSTAFQKIEWAGQGQRGIKQPGVFHEILCDNQNVLDLGLFYTGSVTYSSWVLQSLKQQLVNYRYFRIGSIYKRRNEWLFHIER